MNARSLSATDCRPHELSLTGHRKSVGAGMKSIIYATFLVLFLAGCTPTIQVAAPDKPIEINLNVKIEHEIRLHVDKELDGLFDEDSDVF